jgi:N-carbamoylputrescine amidase
MPADVLLIQNADATDDAAENRRRLVELLDLGTADGYRPDFVLFSELATTPYFCGANDRAWFEHAEPLDGESVRLMQDEAKRRETHILLPFYERGRVPGEFYNSCVLIGPDGEIVPGTLPDGREVHCYRKCHIPDTYSYEPGLNERYYFKGGPGLATFETRFGRVGILICYERSFPEAWRVLALHGARAVFCPVAAYGPKRAESFVYELRTAAHQNGVFVVASNKGGPETVEAERVFSGNSVIVDPFGEVLAEGPSREGPAILRATLDLERCHEWATQFHFFRDRRPELYSSLSDQWVAGR